MATSTATGGAQLSNRQRKLRERQRATLDPRRFPNQTAFRQAERRFRLGACDNPQDPWQDVVDFAQPECNDPQRRADLVELTVGYDVRQDRLASWGTGADTPKAGWSGEQVFAAPRAYGLCSVPGLIVLPGLLTPAAQRYLVQRCLRDYARSPNRTNLDAHYQIPASGVWQHYQTAAVSGVEKEATETEADSRPEKDAYATAATPAGAASAGQAAASTPLPAASQLLRKLRWTTLGYQYDWSSKQYHPEQQHPMPPDLDELMVAIVRCIDGTRPAAHSKNSDNANNDHDRPLPMHSYAAHRFRTEAGVVNFYQLRDTLTAH
ncbi:hypothetical protein THASP1DRAFT_33829, partial [Thamnocephalis sphaerospora]